jgi:hypothetical protein
MNVHTIPGGDHDVGKAAEENTHYSYAAAATVHRACQPSPALKIRTVKAIDIRKQHIHRLIDLGPIPNLMIHSEAQKRLRLVRPTIDVHARVAEKPAKVGADAAAHGGADIGAALAVVEGCRDLDAVRDAVGVLAGGVVGGDARLLAGAGLVDLAPGLLCREASGERGESVKSDDGGECGGSHFFVLVWWTAGMEAVMVFGGWNLTVDVVSEIHE